MTRQTFLAVALLLLAAVITPVAGVGPAAAANNTTTTTAPQPTTTTADAEGGPTTAENVRVLPIRWDRQFLSVETAERDAVYNTSGPFAQFSLTERVAQAQIREPGASVRILEGGQQVKVTYESDAAPVGGESLYHLDLYFADGSQKTLRLYAEKTSVDVATTEIKKYRGLVVSILNDAEDAGYDRTPEGATSHYQDIKETAQLLDSLLSEQAKRAFATVLAWFRNPIGIAITLGAIALLSLYLLKRRGWLLDIISNDSGKAARLRERLWLEYKNQQQTAADEHLSEVPGIDGSREIYWRDAYGVDTVAGLAELMREGVPVERDGEVVNVGGVEAIDPETINDSWLEAVCREHRIAAPEIALSDAKTALHRMISKYGMAHIYQDTYEQTRELIDALDESEDIDRYSASSRELGTGAGGTAAGGDD